VAVSKRTLQDAVLKGKRVFVRVDFNVPLADGRVADDTRIRAALPTLTEILEAGASVVAASHLGRPKGKVMEELRMRPVAARLQELFGDSHRVVAADDASGEDSLRAAKALRPGELLLLENLRFDPGETKNDPGLARRLASLADCFVQDAFGTCHRAHASTVGVPAILKPALAGRLLEKEIAAFEVHLGNPRPPFVAVLGGAKVSDKIPVVEALLEKVDVLLVGGGMAYTFLKTGGRKVGASLVEDELLETAAKILHKAVEAKVKLLLPADHVAADRFAADAATRVCAPDVPDGWMALDIGPLTRTIFSSILHQAGTVVWNGPMGVFEMEPFRGGTMEIARQVAACDCVSVVGGGDSVSAIHMARVEAGITHISTGGGAFLEMLEGKELPGIAALDPALAGSKG